MLEHTILTPMLHWIRAIEPYRLAVTPCPLGFEELPSLIDSWRQAGIDCVVSLLEVHEAKLWGLEQEQSYCEETGLRYISFPMPDHGLPTAITEFESLIETIAAEVVGGKAIAVHCYAGIGRTGMIASCVLHRLGIPADQIFGILKEARGYEMPETLAQRKWVENFIRTSESAL